jgi:2-polyprenyl-6-methoxyphenol hydroxylase-like FAD-dependent oxidoreductase
MHLDALTGQRRQPVGIGGPGSQRPVPQSEAIDPWNADRSVLRSILAHDLEPYIDLGREFVSYETHEGGIVTVKFADGSDASGCLLVGADGARSRVSKQFLPDRALLDTQARCIYGKTPLTPELESRLSSNAMTGLTLVQDRSGDETRPLSLLLEPIRFQDNEYRSELPDDYVYWVLFGRQESYAPADDSTLLKLEPGQAGQLAQSTTSHWHKSFQALFELQDFHGASMIRLASALPQIPQWPANPLITLIGDAIHPMSPTAVVGAVSAIRDAANLSQLIAENDVNVGSIGKYEASMRIYAGEAISKSLLGGKMMFGMKPFQELKAINT